MLRTQIAANKLAQSKIQLANASKRTGSSFTGLLGSIRNLTYAYFSLSAAQQIVGKLFTETKQLNTLDAAFKQTLGSIQDVAAAKEFLIDITTRYGADLLTASNAYLKFGTAAKQAGVSAKVTNDIFESFTKASSVLGLGAERTSYVFLALEQIMSKGRLSTEELRRQLGEHLPGAFGIAAQAMGVTTAKLTDMLKKGEIASTDFLPKFAKQIEIAYGIQNVKKVDNLAAAQGRFNNEITLLIRKLDVAQGFKDFFNALSSGVKFISDNIDAIAKLTKVVIELVVAYTAYKAIMIANRALVAFFLVDSLKQLTMTKALEAAQLRLSLAVRAVSLAWKANPIGVVIIAVTALTVALDYLIDKYDGVKAAQQDIGEAVAKGSSALTSQKFQLDQLSSAYDENQKKLSTLKKGTDQYNEVAAQQKTILRQLSAEGVNVADSNNDQIISQDEVTAAIERYIVSAEKKAKVDALLSKISELSSQQEILDFELSKHELANKGAGFGVLSDKIFGTQLTAVGKRARRDEIVKEIEALKTFIKGIGDPFDIIGGKTTEAASSDLNKFLQENIKNVDDIGEKEALRLKYRQKEVELQKEMVKLSDEELQKVIDTEAAKGRGVGDPFLGLKKRLAGEILTGRAKPPGDDEAGNGKKDTFDAIKERLDLIFNEQERELAILKHAYEEKRKQFIAHNEDTTKLDQKYRDDRVDILNKYIDLEQKALQDAADRQKELDAQEIEAFTKSINERAKDYKLARERKESERKNNVDSMRDEFDARRKHEKEIFDLSTHTSEETNAFELRMKEQELNDEIQLHRIFGKVLNDEELARAIELRDKIREQLGKDGKGLKKKDKGEVTDIFSLLGINFGGDTDKLDAFKEAIGFVGDELKSFTDLQKELVDQQIEDADRLVRSKEENLNRQIALAAANQANNVAGAQAELALAKKTQDEAIKQRKKVQKQELAIDTLSQSSNLITAISAALKLGPILGPIAVGAILATFAASKIKALQLINKKTFRKGGFEEIKGGTHESGNDTNVGGNNYAERDESVGIFNAKATRKYKPTLKAFVNAANKGVLEQILIQDRRAIAGMNFNQNIMVDTSVMEKRLGTLVSLSQKQSFVDGQGRLNIIDRGRKTIVK
jgi:tape measure domain-containing protein